MSEVKTDKLTGTTSAGSIVVTGEGGSTTTNMQQGLAKVWVNFDGGASGAAARDSFNVSGMTDNGSGNYTITINSDMSNVNYSATDSVGDHDNAGESHAWSYVHTHATGSVGHISAHFDGGSNADRSNLNVQICGDLA
tara:strand:+ start:369 stop:782 length:414 start_codon:yes stop_codon:yes gene_type:complete